MYINGDDRGGGGLVLADTGEVKDNKEKKHFDLETMTDDFPAVETMKTVSMGLAIVMCMVVKQACCAGCGADPSRCHSTSRQNPPIQ